MGRGALPDSAKAARPAPNYSRLYSSSMERIMRSQSGSRRKLSQFETHFPSLIL
jgi:hypothetical protein